MPAKRSKRILGQSESDGVQVVRSEGSFAYGPRGRRYIDFVMGAGVSNLGWGVEDVSASVRAFDGPEYVHPGCDYRPWHELAALLISIAPGKPARCFRATGGSEAVELAMQAAILHTGRERFLHIQGSYHGNTLGTLSIGDSSRERYGRLLPAFGIAPPLDAHALARIETRLQRGNIAAFIMEPVIINRGVLVPEREFMTGLRPLCKRYGTVLIADEVGTGFGRTGELFACEHFDFAPDIVCVAKAVTNGTAPLGAMITNETIARSMEKAGRFHSTYGWHPRSVHAAIAVLRHIKRHRTQLLGNVAWMSYHFAERIKRMNFREPATPSICGLAIAVDVHNPRYAQAVRERCRNAGLLIIAEKSHLLLLPALNIDKETADEGLDTLESCV